MADFPSTSTSFASGFLKSFGNTLSKMIERKSEARAQAESEKEKAKRARDDAMREMFNNDLNDPTRPGAPERLSLLGTEDGQKLFERLFGEGTAALASKLADSRRLHAIISTQNRAADLSSQVFGGGGAQPGAVGGADAGAGANGNGSAPSSVDPTTAALAATGVMNPKALGSEALNAVGTRSTVQRNEAAAEASRASAESSRASAEHSRAETGLAREKILTERETRKFMGENDKELVKQRRSLVADLVKGGAPVGDANAIVSAVAGGTVDKLPPRLRDSALNLKKADQFADQTRAQADLDAADKIFSDLSKTTATADPEIVRSQVRTANERTLAGLKTLVEHGRLTPAEAKDRARAMLKTVSVSQKGFGPFKSTIGTPISLKDADPQSPTIVPLTELESAIAASFGSAASSSRTRPKLAEDLLQELGGAPGGAR